MIWLWPWAAITAAHRAAAVDADTIAHLHMERQRLTIENASLRDERDAAVDQLHERRQRRSRAVSRGNRTKGQRRRGALFPVMADEFTPAAPATDPRNHQTG